MDTNAPSLDGALSSPQDSSLSLPSQGFAGTPTTIAAAGGYLDPAMPITQTRLRFDAAFDSNFPDRGEYIYAKCGCFNDPALGALFDPDAEGPPLPESSIDYQDYRLYNEFALYDRFSVFIESGIRAINPEINDNTAGFGDMNAGFKYAFIADPCEYLTLQGRVYIPTGDADRGLGTGHPSLEPALLYLRQSGPWQFQGQISGWFPLDASDFGGEVVSYGAGLGYRLIDNCSWSLTPVTELVGWTFTDGQKDRDADGLGPIAGEISSAEGDTIINIKVGARIGLGGGDGLWGRRSSLYVGYGRALTEDRLYQDLARLEYRIGF
jgi:hypothetical protein